MDFSIRRVEFKVNNGYPVPMNILGSSGIGCALCGNRRHRSVYELSEEEEGAWREHFLKEEHVNLRRRAIDEGTLHEDPRHYVDGFGRLLQQQLNRGRFPQYVATRYPAAGMDHHRRSVLARREAEATERRRRAVEDSDRKRRALCGRNSRRSVSQSLATTSSGVRERRMNLEEKFIATGVSLGVIGIGGAVLLTDNFAAKAGNFFKGAWHGTKALAKKAGDAAEKYFCKYLANKVTVDVRVSIPFFSAQRPLDLWGVEFKVCFLLRVA